MNKITIFSLKDSDLVWAQKEKAKKYTAKLSHLPHLHFPCYPKLVALMESHFLVDLCLNPVMADCIILVAYLDLMA